ncbi:tRNA pseudouridine(38/39) synthase [Cetorhinus maximus]
MAADPRPPGGGAQCPPGGGAQCPPGGAAQCPPGGGAQCPPGGAAQCPPGGGAAQCPPGGGAAQCPPDGAAQCPPGGGAAQCPPGGGAAQCPPGGGAAQCPPGGGAAQCPPGGGAAQCPPGGGAAQCPPGGGAAQCPPGGGAAQCPPGGAAAQCPPGGGAAQCPPGGAAAQCPPGGGAAQCPPGGGAAQCPPGGGAAQCPPGGGAAQCPPGGGAAQCPPGGGAAQCPPGGGAAQCPPGGGAAQCPPGGGAAQCPPGGGAAQCPPGGGAAQCPPGGGAQCPPGGGDPTPRPPGAGGEPGGPPDPPPGPAARPRERRGRRREQQLRPFDFSLHGRRRVALRLAYLGWGYQGFASQENTGNTVEEKLFEALVKTRLVESRQTANYHRSGRTDKGVSAFGQVISLDLRSKRKGEEEAEELRYTHILNRVLPPDIRALAWAPAGPDFSARFSCRHRTYRYYFPGRGLDLGRMDAAARRFEGTHDFRNLCKMDVANGVLNFRRTVLLARVSRVPGEGEEEEGEEEGVSSPYSMCQFEVRGLAFLYHQVRCMAAVLFLVGQRLEEPSVVDELLDVRENPRKPQYSMAVDYPLVLYDCAYENLEWIFDPDVQAFNVTHLQALWTQQAIKSRILYSMLQGLGQAPSERRPEDETDPLTVWARAQPPPAAHGDPLLEGVRPRSYKRLMDRERCEGLESRIRHYAKRGRIQLPEDLREGEEQEQRGEEEEEDPAGGEGGGGGGRAEGRTVGSGPSARSDDGQGRALRTGVGVSIKDVSF